MPFTPYLAERRSIRDFPAASCFSADWKAALTALQKKSSSPTVYIPLGYFPPRSNIDYWIQNKSIIDYEQKTAEIVAAISRTCVVVVKEHPHMLGARSPDFYKQLGSIQNVVIAPPLEYSPEIMEKSDCSADRCRERRRRSRAPRQTDFTFSRTSYWFARSGAVYLDLASSKAGLTASSRPSSRPSRWRGTKNMSS